jgi:hypothetical protein
MEVCFFIGIIKLEMIKLFVGNSFDCLSLQVI